MRDTHNNQRLPTHQEYSLLMTDLRKTILQVLLRHEAGMSMLADSSAEESESSSRRGTLTLDFVMKPRKRVKPSEEVED